MTVQPTIRLAFGGVATSYRIFPQQAAAGHLDLTSRFPIRGIDGQDLIVVNSTLAWTLPRPVTGTETPLRTEVHPCSKPSPELTRASDINAACDASSSI